MCFTSLKDDETELRAFFGAFTTPFPLFSPSNKKRHRIKKRWGSNRDKKMNRVPFHP